MVLAAVNLAQQLDCLEVAAGGKRGLFILLVDSGYVCKVDQDVGISLAKGHEHEMQSLVQQPK